MQTDSQAEGYGVVGTLHDRPALQRQAGNPSCSIIPSGGSLSIFEPKSHNLLIAKEDFLSFSLPSPTISGQRTLAVAFAAAARRRMPMDISRCSNLAGLKLVLTDFDYTFLDSHHVASEANVKAFGEVSAAGIVTAVASGRSRSGTLSCLSSTCQSTMRYIGYPGIFLNGGVVYGKGGELLACTEISAVAQQNLMDKMKEMGILKNILGYTPDRVFCIEKNEYTEKSCEVFREPAPEELPLDQFEGTRFVKLVACGTVESTDRNRPDLEDAVKGQLRCVRPLDWNVEFINPSVSKAVGAKVLLGHLNMTPRHLLAMGDGENDIQVLRLAGVSVAVANACPAAKEAADYTTVSCDESAFAAVAQHILSARRKGY